jgi:hypothetical protein
MSANAQFWLDLAVKAVAAVGTVSAVMVALFKDWFRYRLLPPRLHISLSRTESNEIPNTGLVNPNDPSGSPFVTVSRWYHVGVTNARRWVEATDVQVFLLRVEEPDEAGQFTTIWDDPIPLKWHHMQTLNLPAGMVVGRPAKAALVAFFKDAATSKEPFLQIQTMHFPNRFNPHRVGRCKLHLVLIAREKQVDSNQVTVEVSWDGNWPEAHEKAPRGLVVREVTPP